MARAAEERWARLAVSLQSFGGCVTEFLLLPPWPYCHQGYIGRRSKRALLPLRDLKARRRHAVLVVRGGCNRWCDPAEAQSNIGAGQLFVHPHKGKPCALLLGRAGQQLRPRWPIKVGDIFCVGHTHIRVMRATKLAHRLSHKHPRSAEGCGMGEHAGGGAGIRGGRGAAGCSGGHGRGVDVVLQDARYVSVEDRGRRYQRKARKERRRQAQPMPPPSTRHALRQGGVPFFAGEQSTHPSPSSTRQPEISQPALTPQPAVHSLPAVPSPSQPFPALPSPSQPFPAVLLCWQATEASWRRCQLE